MGFLDCWAKRRKRGMRRVGRRIERDDGAWDETYSHIVLSELKIFKRVGMGLCAKISETLGLCAKSSATFKQLLRVGS